MSELTNEVETTRKQHDEVATEKENISRINDELAGKVKLLKRENKKSLKMVCIRGQSLIFFLLILIIFTSFLNQLNIFRLEFRKDHSLLFQCNFRSRKPS